MPAIAVLVRCAALATCVRLIMALIALLFGQALPVQIATTVGMVGALVLATRLKCRGRTAGIVLLATSVIVLVANWQAPRLAAMLPSTSVTWCALLAGIIVLVSGMGPAGVAAHVAQNASAVAMIAGVMLGLAGEALLPVWLMATVVPIAALVGPWPERAARRRWHGGFPAGVLAGTSMALLPYAFQHVSAAPWSTVGTSLCIGASMLLGSVAARLLRVTRAGWLAPVVIGVGAVASFYALRGAAHGALVSVQMQLAWRWPAMLVDGLAMLLCVGSAAAAIGLAFGWLTSTRPPMITGLGIGLVLGAQIAAALVPVLSSQLLLRPALDRVSLVAASTRGVLCDVKRPREPAGFMRWRGSRITRGTASLEAEPWKWRLLQLLGGDRHAITVLGATPPTTPPADEPVQFVDLLSTPRTEAVSWLARLQHVPSQVIVLSDSPTLYAPMDRLLTREVFTSLARTGEEVFLWLDVAAFAEGEVPRIVRAFLDSNEHVELSCMQSGYIGPFLGLRGARDTFAASSVRDLDQWRLLATRSEIVPLFDSDSATSLVGRRALGRIDSIAEDQPLPAASVLRELETRLALVAPSMAGFLEGLAVHAGAQRSAQRGMELGFDRVQIPKAELDAYLGAATREPDSRMLVNHCLYVCELLLAKKEYELLRDFVQPWCELNPGEARFFYYLGRIGADLRDFELALAPLEQALEIDPGDTRSMDTLATVQGELGHWDRAVPLLEQVRAIEPARKGLAKRLGIANLRLGDRAAARRYLEEARQLTPDDPELLEAIRELGA